MSVGSLEEIIDEKYVSDSLNWHLPLQRLKYHWVHSWLSARVISGCFAVRSCVRPIGMAFL